MESIDSNILKNAFIWMITNKMQGKSIDWLLNHSSNTNDEEYCTIEFPNNTVNHAIVRIYRDSERKLIHLEATYVNYNVCGVRRRWNRHGILASRIPYNDGHKDGMCKFYFSNGALRATVKFVKDKRHGICKNYYRDGSLRKVEKYRDDERYGTSKEYYANGKLRRTSTYKNGIEVRTSYLVSGRIRSRCKYKDGVLCGKGIRYNNDGTKAILKYENGSLISIDGVPTQLKI